MKLKVTGIPEDAACPECERSSKDGRWRIHANRPSGGEPLVECDCGCTWPLDGEYVVSHHGPQTTDYEKCPQCGWRGQIGVAGICAHCGWNSPQPTDQEAGR